MTLDEALAMTLDQILLGGPYPAAGDVREGVPTGLPGINGTLEIGGGDGGDLSLYTLISGVASPADVRYATACYGGGPSGACYVPHPALVAYGIPIDATVGTLTIFGTAAAPMTLIMHADGTLDTVVVTLYQHCAFQFDVTLVDANGAPVDLISKALELLVYSPALPSVVVQTLDGLSVTAGGTGHNVITISGTSTNTINAGSLMGVLRNASDDTALGFVAMNITAIPNG